MKKFSENLITSVLVIVFAFVLISPFYAYAASSPNLGNADSFSVLAGLSMSAAGAGTTISGDLGLSPGLEVSRTGNWILGIGSNEYFGPLSLAFNAQADALGAFNNLVGQGSDGGWDVASWSPAPGVWTVASDVTFTGTITLDGDYDDVWVFQVGQDMTFDGSVVLAGNAQACHVFWQIGRDAVIASGSDFVGTLIASRDITLVSGATVNGRLISLNSSLTTDGNTISGPTCETAPVPTCTLSASPNPVDYNDTSVITWSSTDATACTASGGSTGWTGVSGSSGTWTSGALTLDSTYSMTCTGPGGTSPQCDVSVDVNPAPDPVPDEEEDVDVSDDENDVSIKVTKKASDYKLNSGPKKVIFIYKVTNRGDLALGDISVKDDKCGDVKYVSGDTNKNDLLDINEEWKYTCKKTVKHTETNEVTAKGTANGERVKDTDTAKVVVSLPGLPSAGFAPADNSLWNSIPAFFLF